MYFLPDNQGREFADSAHEANSQLTADTLTESPSLSSPRPHRSRASPSARTQRGYRCQAFNTAHVRTRVRRRGRSKYDLIFMMASLRMLMGVNGRNQRIRSGITVQISRQSWQAQWNKRLGAPVSMHCGKGSESP
jgi:hypothetical protein